MDDLLTAQLVIENCVDFRICNATLAQEVLGSLKNFPRLDSESNMFSIQFIESAQNITRIIKEEGEKALSGTNSFACSRWILKMNLDDALTGSLCSIFGGATKGGRFKREDISKEKYCMK